MKETYEIPNTPFNIVTIHERGSFVALGNWRLTPYLDKHECLELVENKDWSIILSVIQATVTIVRDHPDYMQHTKEEFNKEQDTIAKELEEYIKQNGGIKE